MLCFVFVFLGELFLLLFVCLCFFPRPYYVALASLELTEILLSAGIKVCTTMPSPVPGFDVKTGYFELFLQLQGKEYLNGIFKNHVSWEVTGGLCGNVQAVEKTLEAKMEEFGPGSRVS